MLTIFCQIVVTSVQFNRQLQCRDIKIQNIGSNTILPEDLEVMKLPVTKKSPQFAFSVCLIAAQFLSAVFQRRIVQNMFHI